VNWAADPDTPDGASWGGQDDMKSWSDAGPGRQRPFAGSVICGSLLVLLADLAATPTAAGVPAFPGAEGFGATSVGGRGGAVIEVTNLNDSGPGSFRAAVEASGPRTVVFRVGGTIELLSTVLFTNPYITIAGQTAPGGGIAFKNTLLFNRYEDPSGSFDIRTHDVVIRHVRIRPGAGPAGTSGSEGDAVQIYGSACNVILDHCSMSWAVDENISSWGEVHDLTIQWCLIAEGLRNSVHSKGPHSMGLLIGSGGAERVSVHHNLLAHNVDRNPRFKTSGVVDCVNNVFYDYGDYAGVFTADYGNMPVNYVGNYVKRGPSSTGGNYEIDVWEEPVYTCSIYVDGNLGPHRLDEGLPNTSVVDPADRVYVTGTRYDAVPVGATSATVALSEVPALAGATLPTRDSADIRVVGDVLNGTGQMVDDPSQVGGWPLIAGGTAPTDTDHDGMPDEWEIAHGFDPQDPADGPADVDGDGYTNLEEYMNGTDPRVNPSCGVTLTTYAGSSPDGAMLTTTALGKLYRTDRAYTLAALPSAYGCSVMVAYAETDDGFTGEEFLTLDLTADATVAVAYDARATSLPGWLGGWTNTGQAVSGRETGNGGALLSFNLYTKRFKAGQTAMLGGNHQGAGNAVAGYLVFVMPDGPRPTPSITQQPASQIGRVGHTITFSSQATAAGVLTYQWRKNGLDLLNDGRCSGVNSPVLSISGLNSGDAGRYQLIASDDGCKVTSDEATLTMATPCDYDGDTDVDQRDFGHLQSCLGSASDDPQCQDAHLAGNRGVGAEDFAIFFQCISGPNAQAEERCLSE
jgi:pectate lyase